MDEAPAAWWPTVEIDGYHAPGVDVGRDSFLSFDVFIDKKENSKSLVVAPPFFQIMGASGLLLSPYLTTSLQTALPFSGNGQA